MKLFIITLAFLINSRSFAEGALGGSTTSKTSTDTATTSLTDAQFTASKEYIHEGLNKRKYDEACTGKESECLGRDSKGTFLGLDTNMVRMVAKAYGMVMGAVGMMDEKKDYCGLIPAATETMATFQQELTQKNVESFIPTNQETSQKDSLYRASRSHTARAEGSQIQFIGYGTAAACYPAQMAMTGGFDWKSAAKMAASGLLAFFYKSEVSRYNEAANFTKKVADGLPGKGDCNPINQRNCFCAQPESKNYPEYRQACLPAEIQATNATAAANPITCLDANGKADAVCNCVKTNNCYDKTFSTQLQGLGFQQGVSSAFAPVASLTKGNLSDASISAANAGLQNAMGKLREIDKKFGGEKLYPDQKDVKALELAGFGPNIAAKFASLDPGPNFKNDLAKINSRYSGSIALPSASKSSIGSGDGHIIEFGGGGKNSKKTNSGFDLSKFMPGQKQEAKSGNQVLTYPSDAAASNAMKGADINSDSSRNLFEILSHRYQISAPRRLGN